MGEVHPHSSKEMVYIVVATEYLTKWAVLTARWIGLFPVKKILHSDVYVLNLGKRVGKS